MAQVTHVRSKADSPTRTCHCGRPMRARGLCSTHYNQANVKPIEVTCAACGDPVARTTQQNRERYRPTCSAACRSLLQNGRGPTCPVPASHNSRATACWVPRSHPSRNPARTLECAWCGAAFMARRWPDRYCTHRCKAKALKVRRLGRENDGHVYSWMQVMRVFALLNYCCAYCGEQPDGPPDPDHVVPLSRNGSNGNGNILPACRLCNSDKRDLLLHEWAVDRARRGKQPVRTMIDRRSPAFAHLLPDAVSSSSAPLVAA